MSETAKHTPTPWAAKPAGHDMLGERVMIFAPADASQCLDFSPPMPGEEWAVAIVPLDIPPWGPGVGQANAEFIVRAVNAHEELIAACEAMASAMRMQEERHAERFHLSAEAFMPTWNAAVALGEAAVAKARS